MSSIILKKTFQPITILCLFIFLALPSWAEEGSDVIAASKWIDREIYGKNGNQFGEIDDLIIKRSGQVKKVTIEVGGFLDIGDKLVAVSLGELQNLMKKENGKIVLNTTEEQMEKRKEFDYYRQGLRPDYYYRPRYYRRYDYSLYPPPYLRTMPYGPPPAARQSEAYPQSEPYEWAFSPARFLASAVIGRQVINESGDYIGRVDDLLIDTRNAKVKKIILNVDEVRGDDTRVAVPYEPPGFTAYGIVCDLNRRQISKLPGYSDEN
jgi:sporulation protein YlmC with PRC-barrel domain